jgi:hypothetical protein
METQSVIYKGLTITTRWSSANDCWVVEVFDGEKPVVMKFRSSYQSDDEFLIALKESVELYANGAALRDKVNQTFAGL